MTKPSNPALAAASELYPAAPQHREALIVVINKHFAPTLAELDRLRERLAQIERAESEHPVDGVPRPAMITDADRAAAKEVYRTFKMDPGCIDPECAGCEADIEACTEIIAKHESKDREAAAKAERAKCVAELRRQADEYVGLWTLPDEAELHVKGRGAVIALRSAADELERNGGTA